MFQPGNGGLLSAALLYESDGIGVEETLLPKDKNQNCRKITKVLLRTYGADVKGKACRDTRQDIPELVRKTDGCG